MQELVRAAVAVGGLGSEDFDPTQQPSRGSFYVFVFLAAATILLLLSFLRHLRRAQSVTAMERPDPGAEHPDAGRGASEVAHERTEVGHPADAGEDESR